MIRRDLGSLWQETLRVLLEHRKVSALAFLLLLPPFLALSFATQVSLLLLGLLWFLIIFPVVFKSVAIQVNKRYAKMDYLQGLKAFLLGLLTVIAANAVVLGCYAFILWAVTGSASITTATQGTIAIIIVSLATIVAGVFTIFGLPESFHHKGLRAYVTGMKKTYAYTWEVVWKLLVTAASAFVVLLIANLFFIVIITMTGLPQVLQLIIATIIEVKFILILTSFVAVLHNRLN